MPRRVLFACCFVLSLARPPVPASAAAPEAGAPHSPTQPAEHPAVTEPPRSEDPAATPKDVLKHLAVALRDGDASRIRQAMYAANPSEAKMVAAMADMAKAMATLQKSAVKQFGREGAKEVVGDTDASDSESKARIDSADVKVQGDTATVTMEDGEEAPVVLKRVDGHWRLPMAALAKGADLAALEERLAGLAAQARLVRELADEVGSGKYSTAAQAHEAWQSRAMQASMQRPAAAAAAIQKKPEELKKPTDERR